MALPTDYYEKKPLSSNVYVTRVKGGYLFAVNCGFGVGSMLMSDEEVLEPFVANEPLPSSLYELTNVNEFVYAVLVDGGWIICQNVGNQVISNKITFNFASGMGTQIIQTSAFGEVSNAVNVPVIQATPTYDLVPNNFRTFTAASGTADVSSQLFQVTTGEPIYGYGAIQSFRSIDYKSGQGCLARFSALFQNNVASSWTGVGLLNISDELSFGYDGTAFGIWYRKGGVAAVRTITVTVAASGTTDLTLTLNSVAYTIPLTSGTTSFNAYQIAEWLNANQSVWVADQIGATVIISAQSDGAKGGTYSYSHATSTGTIATNKTGVTKTSTHIPQSSWNNNIMTGLDPTKLNNYAINYGNGNFQFYIEEPDDGDYTLVHSINFLNANTTQPLSNQSLRVGMYAASVGSTTNLVVKCGGFAAFTQGVKKKTRNPRSVKQSQTVSTSFTNILTLRNRRTYNSYYNQVEVEPINISVSSESSKNIEIEVRTNSSFGGATNFASAGNNLVTDVDTTANTTSGGTLLAAFTLSGVGSQNFNLRDFEISVPPSLAITIAGRVTSGASSVVTATLTYYEDL